MLGGKPLVQSSVGTPRGGGTTNLERARGDALVHETTGHDDFAILEEGLAGVLGNTENGGVEHHVASGTFVDQRRRHHGGLDIDEGFENVVVGDHGFGGVDTLLARFGDDRGDGLADVTNLVAGEKSARDHGVERGGNGLQFERGRGEHRDDAGHGLGVTGVDRQNATVCHR